MSWGDYLFDATLWHRKCATLLNQIGIAWGSTSTGSASNYTISLSTSFIDRLIDGESFRFIPNHTNTGAATLTVNSVGSRSITRADGTTALSAGDIVSNIPVTVQYDATNNVYRLVGNAGSGAISATGNLTATAPVALSEARQVIGGAADISVANASASVAGVVTTGAQTFAGEKTFNNGIKTDTISEGTTSMTVGTTGSFDFSVVTNGIVRMLFRRTSSGGTIESPAIRDSTTSSAANVFITAGGGTLQRSTSSIKYKKQVQTLEKTRSKEIYDLRPVRFKSTSSLDDPEQEHLGLIAEEVAEVDPALVHWIIDENGNRTPDGVQYERVSVLLIGVIKELEERIVELEKSKKDGERIK